MSASSAWHLCCLALKIANGFASFAGVPPMIQSCVMYLLAGGTPNPLHSRGSEFNNSLLMRRRGLMRHAPRAAALRTTWVTLRPRSVMHHGFLLPPAPKMSRSRRNSPNVCFTV